MTNKESDFVKNTKLKVFMDKFMDDINVYIKVFDIRLYKCLRNQKSITKVIHDASDSLFETKKLLINFL